MQGSSLGLWRARAQGIHHARRRSRAVDVAGRMRRNFCRKGLHANGVSRCSMSWSVMCITDAHGHFQRQPQPGAVVWAWGLPGVLTSSRGVAMASHPTQTTLRSLIEACMDCEQTFAHCARRADSFDLCHACLARARTFHRAAEELSVCLVVQGELPPEHGSWDATLRRTWRDVRGWLMGAQVKELLLECERVEHEALLRYRHALRSGRLPQALDEVVTRQYHRTEKAHQLLPALEKFA